MAIGRRSPAELVAVALARLGAAEDRLIAASRPWRTPCFPPGAGPDYVNAAAALATRRGPREMLAHLHALEAEFGRARTQRWGSRTLDLDLIAMDDTVLPDPATQTAWRLLPEAAQIGSTPDRLILPHPRLQDRAFVLAPLAEVAPDWVHPLTGLSVAEMLASRPEAERAEMVPLPD
jgi:2-amino-4-hydroxy-6-hydroxymethyldihydropteridine diphosphokinase